MRSKIFFIFLILAFTSKAAAADRITYRDGKVIKGVVVENYADRITFSTFEGEKSIMKSDISRVEYDSLEYNFLDLAQQYQDQDSFERAYFYYGEALKLNPDSNMAKDGLSLSYQTLFKEKQRLKEKEVEKRNIIERFRRTGQLVKEGAIRDKAEILKNSTGIELRIGAINPQVLKVKRGSAAEESGIFPGDKIIAVWSRLTGYLDKDEVISRLIDSRQQEVKVDIERKLKVTKRKQASPKGITHLVGASFVVEWDGITVKAIVPGGPAASAGFKVGDLVEKVENQSCRYMDLKSMYKLIQEAASKVNFVIRRDVTIWKRM